MGMIGPAPWSFSKIKAFEQCPRQFYHEKVLKEFPQKETAAMLYGTQYHEAAEFYIRDGTPLPERFAFSQKTLDRLNAMEGEKICEHEMGITENLQPCGFKDDDVWWRGISDLTVLNLDKADSRVIDYKTGKSARYADKGQLELMAMALFIHEPAVNRVKAALMFVISKEFVPAVYNRSQVPELWDKWMKKFSRMESAFKTDTWNAKPSGLCKAHCPVLKCPHNGRG